MITLKRITVIATIVACGAVWTNAESYTFDVASGVWNDPNNWDPYGTPGEYDTATILNNQTCRIENANQSIQILTINSGGVLQIKGKDLTMGGFPTPDERLTVNGRLEFLKPGNDDPRLLICLNMEIGGSGIISASAGDNLDPGIIMNSGATVPILTIHTGRVKGSVKIRTHLRNRSELLVDHADDVMEIGYMSAGPLRGLVGNDDGIFKVTNGMIRFGAVTLPGITAKPVSKWQVYGGKLELTEYAAQYWVNGEHAVEVTGGTLELNTSLGTNGLLRFTGGEISVAAGKFACFWTPDE